MKYLIITTILFLFSSFREVAQIDKCFVNFPGTDKYVLAEAQREPVYDMAWTEFTTSKGQVRVYLRDSYKVTYKNKYDEIFVELNLKLAQSNKFKDQWLDRCKLHSNHHANDHNAPMPLIYMNKNGFELYGTEADSIDNRNLYAIFYLFINEKFLITLRFPSPASDKRTFQSLEEFRREKDSFIDAFTAYLDKCRKK